MAKALMIQGTMSNAGKSLICTGLCRIFHQDGYRVAPFKSQNMALNSYITRDGGEMGRAQAVQAEAAGAEPDVRMNPILLKPSSDVGSQVIIKGRVRENMEAMTYFRKKKELIPVIKEAYEELSAANDIIVIEGAGSPVELNLLENDIVNMGMANMADAPVLICGDIDRGGIFAQLYGTVALLKEEERKRVKGLIINKFRGNRAILEPGIRMLEDLCEVPVAGVVPFLDIDIEEEDSLSERFAAKEKGTGIDIAVIRLPHISNYTDFAPLERAEGVSLRYADSARVLGRPDLIILPGTKSTVSDLSWLRESGIANDIVSKAELGIPVIGICGGFQMLCRSISDPLGSEAEKGSICEGLGLIDLDTVFAEEKIQRRSSGALPETDGFFSFLSGLPYEGYEIHMGRTEGAKALNKGRYNVCGTYLHGLFESEAVADKLLEAIAKRKGSVRYESVGDHRSYKEAQYDRLADALRESLDMEMIYGILGREGGM